MLFPGALVVASVCSRQGFLTPGSDALASRPSQSLGEISAPCWKLRNRRYTVAGTVWAFHPTSLVTLMGTCNGPVRRSHSEIECVRTGLRFRNYPKNELS